MALSDNDLAQFRKIIEERQAKRQARINKAAPKKVRKDYSHEEYQRRLIAENKRTQEMVKATTTQRVQASLDRWQEIVGPRFFGAGIIIEEEKIAERVRLFQSGESHFNSSCVLSGDLGVGKTWRAYGYAEKLIRENILQQPNIVVGTEISILGSIASSGFRKPDKMAELMDDRHKFFLIDEVGRTKFPNVESRHEIWYELINYIYMNDLTLVISTNMSATPFEKPIHQGEQDGFSTPRGFQSLAAAKEKKMARLESSNAIVTNEIEEWIGKAAYDRLKHIVGDGMIIPTGPNRRPGLTRAEDPKKSVAGNQKVPRKLS
jgi:DNA replication protein DnaC